MDAPDWEYNVLKLEGTFRWFGDNDLTTGESVTELNRLGRDGWELVSVLPSKMTGSVEAVICVFKRQRPHRFR